MASTSETRVYSTLFTTTLDDYRPQLVDQIHKSIPLLFFVTQMGRGRDRGAGRGIRFQTGGAKIKIPVIWAKNNNVKAYSKFETLKVEATDEETVGIDVLRNIAQTVGISGEEMDQNDGLPQMRDMLRDKVDVAEMSLKEEIERMLVQGTANATARMIAGTGGKEINPLAFLLQKDFSVTDSIHEIPQATETWWRNKTLVSGTPATFLAFWDEMNELYMDCAKGSGTEPPDLVLCQEEYYRAYERGIVAAQRYEAYSKEGVTSAGVRGLNFKGAVVFWSEVFPDLGNTGSDAMSTTTVSTEAGAMFINTRFYELVISAKRNFAIRPFVEPYDQDALWAKILTRIQQTVTQRRKHGLHIGVDTTAIP